MYPRVCGRQRLGFLIGPERGRHRRLLLTGMLGPPQR